MKAKTVQQSYEDVARITRRIFKAPNPLSLALPILLLSLLIGFVIAGLNIYQGLFYGFFLFALPTYLAALASKPLAELFGGKLYIRRSTLLAFVSLLIIFIVIVMWQVICYFLSISLIKTLIFAYASILGLRQTILAAISNENHLKSLPASINQTVFGFAAIYITLIFPVKESILSISLLSILFVGISLITAIIFTEIVKIPLRKSFGGNSLAMVRYSLDHMTEGGSSGKKEVEDFFDSFSVPISAHVGVLAFKNDGGIKAVMIIPSIHPGPFGDLGGSNLPTKLSNGLKGCAKHILVAHGPSTHDLNPSRSEECEKIVSKVKKLLSDVEYSSKGSRFIRCRNDVDVCAQVFGDSVLLIETSAPNPTDDVDFPTGIGAMNNAKSCGAKDALFIDAHNCGKSGSGLVQFCSPKSMRIMELAKRATTTAFKNGISKVKMGYASQHDLSIENGIGAKGIQVMIVEVGNQKSAYILYDGNNMIPGLREEIMHEVKGLVDEVEVLTTDNHVVNIALNGYNPVGLKMEGGKIKLITKKLIKEAIADLEEVQVGMKTGFIEDFKVFGAGNTMRLATVVNSTVSMLGRSAALSSVVAVLACVLVSFML